MMRSTQILIGHAPEQLATLPEQSVQCCISSPPYWGLRSYLPKEHPLKHLEIGSEKTPAEYVAKIVEVFRGVKRVLRDDGVLWLNVGSTYATTAGERTYGSYDGKTGRGPGTRRYKPSSSRDNDSTQSPLQQNAPACDNDGKEPQDYHPIDSACSDLCDECRAVLLRGTDCTSPLTQQSLSRDAKIARGSEPSDCEGGAVGGAALVSRESTMLESSPQRAVSCSHCANCGACLSVLRSSSRDGSLCARNSVYSDGTIQKCALSAGHTLDRGLFSKACSTIKFPEFKDKDLIPIPMMVAMALVEDGWYLRARCPWIKRNGMPESTDDRPTTVVEDIFLLSKSADYFYDSEAVKLRGVIPAGSRGAKGSEERLSEEGVNSRPAEYKVYDGQRLRRSSDWFFESWQGLISNEQGEPLAFMVNTAAFGGAHFATFPKRLVIPMIQAGTSEKGCCAKCGAPWVRQLHKVKSDNPDSYNGSRFDAGKSKAGKDALSEVGTGERTIRVETSGWKPSCECCADLVPCAVLDPFGGSGTVGEVAKDMNRSAILIDLNDGYKPLLESRCLPGPGEFDL